MTERDFTAAAERYLDMVYRLALNCLRNPADAEDAAQTAMLRLWQRAEPFSDDDHLRHWLVRVTLNVCKDTARGPWRRRLVPLEHCREPVFDTPEHQTLYAEVMALPARSWPCRPSIVCLCTSIITRAAPWRRWGSCWD